MIDLTFSDWVPIDGKTHHIAVTFDKGWHKVYVDGIQAVLEGYVTYWDHPLTDLEIRQLYAAGYDPEEQSE